MSSNLEAKLLPRLLQSPDPVGLCVSDLAVHGPASPSTHSVSLLSPKLGAPSSVTAHVPRAQTRRTVFPKEGGARWGSSLLWWGFIPAFPQRTGGIGVCYCYRISRKVRGGIIQTHGSKQLPGFEEDSRGARVKTPTSSKESFTRQKCSLFPVGWRNIRLRNVSAPFPAHT